MWRIVIHGEFCTNEGLRLSKYDKTKSRRGSMNLIKRLDSVFPSLGMPGANEL